ncbi:MAG: ferrous iron transport protein A [Wujia sp.]
MMPLSLVNEGEPNIITRIGGRDETRKFLANLGLVNGTEVTVVSTINGNLILNVRDSRVAIGRDMANKIMVA